jgi:flavin-dependent dehydrogenase
MKTPPHPSAEYDVVVAGGGPGGAALATLLAKAGHRCLILDRDRFPRYHVGESLIPHTYRIFERLGLLEKLKSSEFPLKHSVRFVTRDGRDSAPFYFSEIISGPGAVTWQVERGEFDRLLLDHAREHGVEVRDRMLVDRVLFENGQATGVVAVSEDGEPATVAARVVVDASGRACLIGNQLQLKADVPGLHKASLWGYFRGGKRLPGIDAGETTIFMLREGGWFWYIPLPDDIISCGIVADPGRLFIPGTSGQDTLHAEIAACPALAERLERAHQVGPVRGLPELAYLNRRTCGDGWIMIGDARAFLDPIYFSGMYLALASAELAADAIHGALADGDVSQDRLGLNERDLWNSLEVTHRLIHSFYDSHFTFAAFAARFPEHRATLINCLTGNVLKDMTDFTAALATMTPPPPLLAAAA